MKSVAKIVYGLVDRFFEVHNLPFTIVMGLKYNLPLSHLSLLGFEREWLF